MAKSHGRRSGELVPRAIRLPDELVTAALEYMPFFSLWSAAAVSRQFYKAAWHAGLYIPTKLIFNARPHKRPTNGAQLQRFIQVLEHVQRKDLRLRLTLALNCPRLASDPSDDHDIVQKSLLALTAALPFLVALAITIPDELSAQVSAALRHPAPRLRSLTLSRFHFGQHSEQPVTSPPNLFAGYAPRLCELGFFGGALGQERTPAFSNIVRLDVCQLKDPLPSLLSRHFPRLAVVNYDLMPPATIDCEGAALRRINILDQRQPDDADFIRPRLKLDGVSEVRYQCDAEFMAWDEPLGWRTDGGPLNVRLSTERKNHFVEVAVVSADATWRRTYFLDIYSSEPRVRLHAMPGLPQALGYLRIETPYLVQFLQTPERYPVLRCVRVDVRESDEDMYSAFPMQILVRVYHRTELEEQQASGACVRCPALETLSLVAIAPSDKASRHEMGGSLLKSSDVAFVRRALSPRANPVLELVAISVTGYAYPARSDEPVFADLFATIRKLPSPGETLGAHFDDGLWEEHVDLEAESDDLPACLPRP